MNRKITPFRRSFFLPFFLLIAALCMSTVLYETPVKSSFSVNEIAEVLTVTLTSPVSVIACGAEEVVSIRLENTDPSDDLENVIAEVTLPNGVSISGLSSGATATANGFTLDDDLESGDVLIIDVSLQADCEVVTQTTVITVSVSHDPVAAAMNNMVSVDTDPINFVVPVLDIAQALPATVMYPYAGFEFSVESTVENTSSAAIGSFTYCVEDNAVATLVSVTVAGNALVASPSPVGQQCFSVSQTDIQNALGGAFANASFPVVENWQVVMCGNGGTLSRRVEFGCETNDNCADDDFGAFPGTMLAPDVPDPVVTLDIDPATAAMLSLCGPGQTYTFTVTYNGPAPVLESLVATINLPDGILQSNLTSTSTGVSYTANPNEIQLPDLTNVGPGNTVSFTLDINASCVFTDAAGTFNFTLNHDPLCENSENTEESAFASFFVQAADLSIPASSPDLVEPYAGLTTSIFTTVANGGNGSLSQVIYCLTDVDYATLTPMVAGIPLTPTTGEPGFQCFLIEEVHFMALFGTSVLPPDVNFEVEEVYTFTDCPPDPQVVERRAQFGCFGETDCQNKDQGEFPSTSVIFSAIPDMSVSLSSIDRPACYADELIPVDMVLTNTGNAPTSEMVVQITAGGGAIDLSNYAIIDGSNMLIADQTVDSGSPDAGHCTSGIRVVLDTIRGINLEPGETLSIHYDLTHSCDCNNCSIIDIYHSTLSVVAVQDLCPTYRPDGSSTSTGSYNAYMNGFVEGPLDLNDGEKATIEYTITSAELDWFDDSAFPDAYLETFFTIECGLDYQPGTAVWQDADGTTWVPCEEEYVDNNLGGDDMLRLRWCKTNVDPSLDRPGGFSIGAGMVFTLCAEADCGEKPVNTNCGNPVYDLSIQQETFFTIDPSCTSCPSTKIFAPEPLNMRIFCPDPGCVCDGMVFENFSLVRSNFDLGDGNNDQVPDGPVDLSLVQADRYLQGDTLKATFGGRVSDPNNTDWTYGFAVINFPPGADYQSLNASVEIIDQDGATHACNVVPVEFDPANQNLIINFSRDTLNSLGCDLPTNFNFDQDDEVSVCLSFQVKTPYDGQIRQREFTTDFYLSDAPFESGSVDACNDWQARLYQVGLSTEEGAVVNDFGACSLSSFSFRYERYAGEQGFDEFPYEVRPLGLPQTFTFTKPNEFAYRLDDFGVRLQQQISPSNNIVDLPNGVVPPAFISVSGDELVFAAQDYFESLGNAEIPPDEGYEATFYVSVQGGCQSVADSYDLSYQLDEAVNPDIYCTDLIERSLSTASFMYTGGANLVVISETPNVRVCSGLDTIAILVTNTTNTFADNAFLYLNSPTGGVVVEEVIEDGTNMAVSPNSFGIYPIGGVNGTQTRRFQLVVRVNNCQPEELDVVAGWDCEALPTTIEDALCSDPSSFTFTSANAGINLDIIDPVSDITVPLCEPVPYELEIRSTDLGYLRDIGLYIFLPTGQVYVPGSMELAVPAGATYESVNDPISLGGGLFLDVSVLDETLSTVGLIGSKDLTLTQNKIRLRFLTETTCDYFSGSQVKFVTQGNSNCGDPLGPVSKPGGRLRVTNQTPDFSMNIDLADLTLNACHDAQATSFVSLSVTDGSPGVLDSIRYLLPPGLTYVDGSFQPILNITSDPPVVNTLGGQQVLSWSLGSFLNPGDNVSFSIDVQLMDIGQACTDYDLAVQAYTRVEETCDGDICSVAIAAGEGTATLTVVKPDLSIDILDATLTLSSSTEALAAFDAEVCNLGPTTLQSGETVSLEIYEDVDLNGFRSAPDILLFTITETLTDPLEFGECILLAGTEDFPSTSVCTIIGVLNPETTCTCREVPSFQVEPEIIIDFPMAYTVCSGDPISIGPDPIDGYDFEWLSIDGSSLANLSDLDLTTTDFQAFNNTGTVQTIQYALRSSNRGCYELDTVTIQLQPSVSETADINACVGEMYQLPSLNIGGENFVWMPSAGLSFPGPDSSFVVIDPVIAGLTTYTVNYQTEDGCGASFVYNVNGVDCGGATASLGDTVWFDFDQNGLQSMGEPGIAGTVVNLYDGVTGALIGTTTTDANGFYQFDDLVQGSYTVEFVPLDGFVGTGQDSGDDTLDSDADPNTGFTTNYFLPWDTYNPTIDAGFIPDCSLEVEALISDCQPVGNDLQRELTIEINWEDNPYTYDQFFGDDTLVVSYYGITQRIAVTDLSGNLVLTDFIDQSSAGETVTVAFVRADDCTATTTLLAFEPCSFDLALRKTITNLPGLTYGDTVCFNIELENQGEQAASQIRVNDYLPDGYGFLPMLNPDWTQVAPDRLVTIVADTLSPGETIDLPLKVRLNMASSADSWTNFAEIAASQDTLGNDVSVFDEDSTPDNDPTNDPGGDPGSPSDDVTGGTGTGTPGSDDPGTDEDDHDPAILEVFDLALTKTLITDPPYAFGDEVTFLITVINQGNITARDITVTDSIPGGFAWLGSNTPPWTLMGNEANTTIAGPLAPGQEESVMITLQLQDANADEYVNIAEISSAFDEDFNPRFDDIDSTPDSNLGNDAGGNPGTPSDDSVDGDGTGNPNDEIAATDEDDQDPAFVTIPDIGLVKQAVGMVPAASGVPGHYDVTFQFIITNDGNEKLSMLQLTDNMIAQLGSTFINVVETPSIVSLTDATEPPTPNPGYNGGAIDELLNGMDGCLDPDQTITVQIVVEMDADTGLDPIINEAVVTGKDPNGVVLSEPDTALVVFSNCFLDVNCPAPNGGTFACLVDLPAAATTVAEFNAIDQVSAVLNACGMVTISAADSDNGGTGCVGDPYILTRTYTISDPGDGTSPAMQQTCTVTYTVEDDEAPAVICPGPLTTQCLLSDLPAYTDLTAFTAAGGFASDNCGITAFSLSNEVTTGTCPATTVRTYQVEDACGTTSTCNQIITVDDTEPPVISCPTIETDCALSDIPAYTSLAEFLADGNTASDNCGIDAASFMLIEETTDGNTCPQIVLRKYRIRDNCGNEAISEQLITIDDELAPTFAAPAPADATLDCDATIPAPVTLTATDNCLGTVPVNYTEQTVLTEVGECAVYSYQIIRQWTAVDDCGNMNFEEQVLTIQDNTMPTALCVNAFSINIEEDFDGLVSITPDLINNGSTDNCTPADELAFEVDVNSLSCADLGNHTVTLTVTDDCGNSNSCSTVVSLVDETAPEIDCPSVLVLTCGNSSNDDLIAEWLASATAQDGCTADLMIDNTYDVANFANCGNTGDQEVTFTASDGSGNSSSCSATISLQDNLPPTLVCPPALVTCDLAAETPFASLAEFITGGGSADDDCALDASSFAHVSDVTSENIITRTYEIADACGNTTSCQQLITVLEQPTVGTGNDVIISCSISAAGSVSLSALFPDATPGGTYTYSGETGASIQGDALIYEQAGCFSVSYEFTAIDAGICDPVAAVTAYVYVSEQPQPSFDLAEELCWDGSATTLSALLNSPVYTNTPTRTWTSSDPTIASVDAAGNVSILDGGMVQICLEESITHDPCNGNSAEVCTEQTCHTLTITETSESVDASWTSFGPLCTDDMIVDLDDLVLGDANGVFTGDGVSGTHPEYSFDPSTGADLYTITYSVTNASGCTAVETHTVEVFDPVDASLNDLDLGCLSDPVGNISLSALFTPSTTLGGSFSGTGVSGNTLTYSSPGCYEVTYTVSAFPMADGGCTASSTAFIYIQEQPEPSFNLTDQLCWDGVTTTTLTPVINSPVYTNTVSRVWSSSNTAVATIDAGTGEVTVVGSGMTTICLEETISHLACDDFAANDCVVEVCQTLLITETNESVDASWTSFGPLCTDDMIVDLDDLVLGDANGVFTGDGVSGTHPEYSFDPSTGAGLYTITYSVTNASGCTAVETHTVEVFGPVDASLNDLDLGCVSDPVGNISLSALFTTSTTLGGSFSGTGVSGNTLTYSGPGCYEVTYTVSAFPMADGGCTASSTAFIYIQEQPEP
ncbi:MAG: SdrD B-like domain-containing protein, partial [Bacteroidota bacterium]